MEDRFLCGSLPSIPDVRDYSVKMQRPVALPSVYKQKIGANYDQTGGTCVMQTIRNILREIFGIEFGVNMGYGGFRTHEGPGLYPNVAANGVCKYGIAPERYDPGEMEVMEVITYYQANKARLHKSAEPYAGLTWGRATTAEQIKSALYSGLYVAACFAISQYACKPNGIFPCTEANLGYHEMRVFGWDIVDGSEYACVQNSWGDSWGKYGECYVSWEDVLRVGDVIVFTPLKDAQPDIKDTIIRRTLRKGMKGTDVQQLQKKLLGLGYILIADGNFGTLTRLEVKKFQKRKGLTADGIVGPKTWEVLDRL